MEAHAERREGCERIVLSMTRDQLLLLAGAVNEAIEAVDDGEFTTRLGAVKDSARALRAELRDAISKLPPDLT